MMFRVEALAKLLVSIGQLLLSTTVYYTPQGMVGAKAALPAIDELRQSWMEDRPRTNNGGGVLGMIIGRGVRRQLVLGARQSCSDDSIKVPLAGLFPTHNTVLSPPSVTLKCRVLRRFDIPSPHEPYPYASPWSVRGGDRGDSHTACGINIGRDQSRTVSVLPNLHIKRLF